VTDRALVAKPSRRDLSVVALAVDLGLLGLVGLATRKLTEQDATDEASRFLRLGFGFAAWVSSTRLPDA
jgi:hypothetical protein